MILVTLSLAAVFIAADTANCGARQGGAILGQIVDDSTSAPVQVGQVVLVGARCFVATDSLGRFGLTGVPVGRHVLQYFAIVYSPGEVSVDVAEGITHTAILRIREQNPVRECRERPECLTLLDAPMDSTLSVENQLRETALRTGLALYTHGGGFPAIICVRSEAPEAVIVALRRRVPQVVSGDRCRVVQEGYSWHFADRRTGSRAWVLSGDGHVTDADAGGGTSGVESGMLNMESFTCEYARHDGQWRVIRCPFWVVS